MFLIRVINVLSTCYQRVITFDTCLYQSLIIDFMFSVIDYKRDNEKEDKKEILK